MRDVAIVGMGCRFPGANNLQEYWRLLLSAQRQFRPVPAHRWNHAEYYDPADRRASQKSYTDRLATIEGVDQFDATYFRMSPRRVQTMDPQHRILLQVTREAMQDAGWERDGFDRESTGVYFGMSVSDYLELMPDVRSWHPFSVPGGLLNMAAATVSEYYDLGGPSFTMDAACSSGLVALYEAVTHLRAGRCAAAVVGGAYLTLAPSGLMSFSKVGALSRAGVCRPFDRRADGFVLGEGVGVVLLRPLRDAITAGDRIYAVIRGIGASNDGSTDGPMTPRLEGQVRAVRRAYADAGVTAGSIGFIEAHGTATPVGDRVELETLKTVRSTESGEAYLSSVKSLIGHSLTASGLASLIKTALVLHHATIVPQPETDVDPEAGLAEAGLRIATEPEPWSTDGAVRRAAVSGFGFGGTNVHVVLQETAVDDTGPESRRPELFLLSAGSITLLVDHIDQILAELPSCSVGSVAYTLARRRLLPVRLAIVADGMEELVTRLRQARQSLVDGKLGYLGDAGFAGVATVRPADRKVAFLFPGQGSQRIGMFADLYRRFPVFRHQVDALDAGLAGLSVVDAVYGDSADQGRLTDTDVCQPTLGVLGLAAARLAQACGVTPELAFGHSVGEFPAAAVAGVLTDEDAVAMLALRGSRMRAAELEVRGGMLALRTDAETADKALDGLDQAWLSCYNQPNQTVVSGTFDALDQVARRCAEMGVSVRRLDVSNGFHSPLVESARRDIVRDLADARLSRPVLDFISSVNGTGCTDVERIRGLWADHAVSPVHFGAAAVAAYDAGTRVFVQVGGDRSLLTTVRQNLTGRDGAHYVALSGEKPDDCRGFLSALGTLAVLGVPIDTAPLFDGDERVVSLPPSPLRTRRYWLADSNIPAEADRSVLTTAKEHAVNDVVTLLREQLAVLRAYDPGSAVSASPAAAAAAPVPTVASARLDGIQATVCQHISRISAFPADQLRPESRIVQELGFDSLMTADLVSAMRKTWPQLANELSPRAIVERPTIGEVVATVAGLLGVDASASQPEIADEIEPTAEATVEPEYRIEDFADARAVDADLSDLGEHNPFFLLHEGTATDTTSVAGRELISFSGYNYLGLSGHPAVRQAVVAALDRYGSSVSASRFLSGDRPLHLELEAELAALLGTEDAMAMVSGHATNVSVIGHLLGPEDLVVHDTLAHDSILQGCKLAGARRLPFPHNDIASLDALLSRTRHAYRRALVVVEGVYSMDGDIVDLPALIETKTRHKAMVLIDEAHSVGVIGKGGGGVGEHFGVDRSAIDLWSGTLSKSLASCGGYVAGSSAAVRYLKNTVPGFVYSVGMTPPNAAAALAAIRTMRDEPQRLDRLRTNAKLFLTRARKAGLNTGTSADSPVVPCIVGDSSITVKLAEELFNKGISVNPIMYPAVPEEQARLRFFITSEHTAEQINTTVSVVSKELKRLRRQSGGGDLATPATK